MSNWSRALTSESASNALMTSGSLVLVRIRESTGAASLIVPE